MGMLLFHFYAFAFVLRVLLLKLRVLFFLFEDCALLLVLPGPLLSFKVNLLLELSFPELLHLLESEFPDDFFLLDEHMDLLLDLNALFLSGLLLLLLQRLNYDCQLLLGVLGLGVRQLGVLGLRMLLERVDG